MKNIQFILTLLFAFFIGQFSYAQDWPNLERYQKENAELSPLESGKHRIVFMGNSITEHWRAAFFEGKPHYVNRAISGQTTPQMLLRFKQDVIDLEPSVVVIMAGINDIAGNTGPATIDMIATNIISMMELAKVHDIKVVLCSVMPAYKFPWSPEIEPAEQVVQLNKKLSAYSKKHDIVYVDYFSATANDLNGLKEGLGEDGVHPNALGYSIMEPLVEAGIAKALAKTTTTVQVDTLMIFSQSMNKNISNVIITPENYDAQNEQKPVLYLLHGAYGDHTDWTSKVPAIKEFAHQFDMIIVCPDGGYNSWYFDSPVDADMKYEAYMSKELIEAIDKNYNTIAGKNGRAITGLSMGGHGALYLAFRHQDIWGAAGSMSGAVDIRPFTNDWDIPKRLGKYNKNKKNWTTNTVTNMLHLLKDDMNIIFDCGYDDFFFKVNQKFHQKLTKRNIPHVYIERPGGHDWEYWANAIEYQLIYFNDFFEK